MKIYTNPILDHDFPDPSVIRASDGIYYTYATQYLNPKGIVNIQVAKSSDLVNWTLEGDAMPLKPKWSGSTQNFWAPNVIEKDGLFYLFFSADTYNKRGMAIGVALSSNPLGPFIDSGEIIVEGKNIECIDPMSFNDPVSGKIYLLWGSGSYPIRIQELDNNGLKLKKDTKPIDILFPSDAKFESLIEASYLIYENNNYYLFYSGNNCWENHTYAVMVARAKSIFGPFEKFGKPIMQSSDKWYAPGANSIIKDLNQEMWMIYHAVNPNNTIDSKSKILKRVMMLDKIHFKDGWPRIENNSPSYLPKEAPEISIEDTTPHNISWVPNTATI